MGEAPLAPALLSALAWQIELGADEAIAEHPADRFEESRLAQEAARPPDAAPAAPRRDAPVAAPPVAMPPPEPVATPARPLAEAARTLAELADVMRGWDGSPLRDSARNFVFSDGLPGARVMVIGEAPGADEDRIGRPFVGRAGQLLDRMLAAIGLDRKAEDPARAVYITNVLPWRPPGNRTPSEAEAQAFLPFVEAHIRLARPEFVLSMGNTPTRALLATTGGITRLRGKWVRHGASGLPLMPTFHPANLLRSPENKRPVWTDLIQLRRALDGAGPDLP